MPVNLYGRDQNLKRNSARIYLNVPVKCMLKTSQQWTKAVKKMVGNNGQVLQSTALTMETMLVRLDGGHYSGDYENGCNEQRQLN